MNKTISRTFQQEISKSVLEYVKEPKVELMFYNNDPYFMQYDDGEISEEEYELAKKTLNIKSDDPCGIIINEHVFSFDNYGGEYKKDEVIFNNDIHAWIKINFLECYIEIINTYNRCPISHFKMTEREYFLLKEEFKKYKLI